MRPPVLPVFFAFRIMVGIGVLMLSVVASHPAVASCAVIGIPHELYGEAVHAVVVLVAGATVDTEEIRAHCRTLIAGYKCPRSVEIRAARPLSGAGKILKRELRKPHWDSVQRKI